MSPRIVVGKTSSGRPFSGSFQATDEELVNALGYTLQAPQRKTKAAPPPRAVQPPASANRVPFVGGPPAARHAAIPQNHQAAMSRHPAPSQH